MKYHIGSNYKAAGQYALLVFSISKVLEGPILGATPLETSNCNKAQ
jgi:hypothetical protein